MHTVVPRLSVIIGFRDWGVERLRLAVRSHRQSTLAADLEVIVVDYGSRDAEEVRRTVEEEGGRVMRVEAVGRPWSRARALNYGIRQAARGPLLLTTDSDILFAPHTAETILSAIQNASGPEGTYALVQCRDLPPSYPEEHLQGFDWISMEARSTLRPRYGMGGCACFPRSFVETVRGYDERMEWWGAEDRDLASRAEATGIEICWVEHPNARIYHLWHEKILEKHRDDAEFQKIWARNRHYLTGSRTLYRNLDEWGGLSSPPVPVSVVIATRDGADLLAQVIDSVLVQTYQNFELVVVDDGTKGEIRPIVESFQDPRIRYLQTPPSGARCLQERGMSAVRGTYVYLMDDGDLMLPHCLEDHLYAMTPRSAGSHGAWIELTGKTKELRYHPGKRHTLAALRSNGNHKVYVGVMMRRELLSSSPDQEDPEPGSDGDRNRRSGEAGPFLKHTGTYVFLRHSRQRRVAAADGAEGRQGSQDPCRAFVPPEGGEATLSEAEKEIKLHPLSGKEIARLFPAVFAQTPKSENADLESGGGKSERARSSKPLGPQSRRELVGDLLSRPAHLAFLAAIAALGITVSAAWLFRIIDSTGLLLGMTILGAAYALGFLMLRLERSLADEVMQARFKLARELVQVQLKLANRIAQAIDDQITGIRAQQAEDAGRAAQHFVRFTNRIHATQEIQRLELRGLPLAGSEAACDDFLYLLVRSISDTRPRTLVDLGSALSALVIARALALLGSDARFYSVQPDRQRLEEAERMLRENALKERVELVLAPIRETRFGRFYDLEAFISGLESVDMLIVAGPPLHLGAQIRRSAMDFFHPLLSDGATVFFDDGHREGARDPVRRWKLAHPELGLQFVDNFEGCFVLRKPRAPVERSDAESRFLAAPKFSLCTSKVLFIGGIISTGTTLLKAALLGCNFATSTGKYEDGRHDPDYPPVWAEGTVDPTAPASEAFQAWVESYCFGPWLIEKTPDRYLHFLAIQKRLGPERSYFLMMQRDPYQTIALIQRRHPERHGLGPGHPPGRITTDDPGLVRRLRQAIAFHEDLRPELQRFRYVRYEALCADPKRTLADILGSLGVGVAPRALGRAAALVKQDARRYPITVESDKLRSAANRLCRLWGYPER